MSNFYFFNILILLPFLTFFFFSWFFFLKNNFFSLRINSSSVDILKNSKIFKKVHYIFFINWFLILIFNINFFVFFLKFDFCLFWYNHLKLNNFIYYILHLILFLNFFLFFFVKFYKNTNINYNIDYFFSLFNIGLFVSILYFSNTIYSFIFILETISILILYKFSVSRFFFKNNIFYKNTSLFENQLPRPYLNLIFFQYWVNFFSSVILFFCVFNILLLSGTSDWLIINILNKISSTLKNDFIYFFIYIIFIIGMFLKIGFTPTHFFKIEVYKGLSLVSILFYTVFYFMSFFLYFILIIFYYNTALKTLIWFFLFIFIVLGLIYVISLFFDINLVKNFFAYSTIINSLTFIILTFVSIS